jgi:hypothetical protein
VEHAGNRKAALRDDSAFKQAIESQPEEKMAHAGSRKPGLSDNMQFQQAKKTSMKRQ